MAPAGRSEKAGALSEQFMWEPVGREPGPIRPRAMRQDTHRADREANSSPRIPRSALGQVVFSRPRLVSRHRAVMADRAPDDGHRMFPQVAAYPRWHKGWNRCSSSFPTSAAPLQVPDWFHKLPLGPEPMAWKWRC